MGKSIDRNYALRETINAGFDKARFLADGVLLEFGPSRQPDLALRSRIRQWQTQLRVIFIARTTLWKYRMRLPGFELPDNVLEAHRDFDEEMAKSLDGVADRMEGKAANTSTAALDDCFAKLEHVGLTSVLDGTQDDQQAQLTTLLLLSRKTAQLAVSLNIESEDHQAALLAISPPVAS